MPYKINQGALSLHNKYLQEQAARAAQGDPLMGTLGAIAGTAAGAAIGGPAGAAEGATLGSTLGGAVGGAVGGSLGSQGDLSQVSPEKIAMNVATQGLGDYVGEAMDSATIMDDATKFMADTGIDASSDFGKAIMQDAANKAGDPNMFTQALGNAGNFAQSNLNAVGQGIKDTMQPLTDSFNTGLDNTLDTLKQAADPLIGTSPTPAPVLDLNPPPLSNPVADANTLGSISDNLVQSAENYNVASVNPLTGKMELDEMTEFASRGGPIGYHACGGKMPKYRAAGGSTYMDEKYDSPFTREQDPQGLYQNKHYGILSFKPVLEKETNPITILPNGITYDRATMFSGQRPGTFSNKLVKTALAMQPEYRAYGGYAGSSPSSYSYDQYKKDKEAEDAQKDAYGAFYRAEGGGTGGFFDYIKRSFTEKPAWADDVAVQVPVTDSSGNPVTDRYGNAVTSTVYKHPASAPQPKKNIIEQEIERDIYGEYEDDNYDPTEGMARAYGDSAYTVQRPDARYTEQDMFEGYVPQAQAPRKGGPLLRKFGAPGVRRNPEEFNRDLNEYSIKRNRRLNEQPSNSPSMWDNVKGFFSSMGKSNGDDADVSGFSNGGRVGPLKSVKYKSAGGDVMEQNYYEGGGKAVGNQDQGNVVGYWANTYDRKPYMPRDYQAPRGPSQSDLDRWDKEFRERVRQHEANK